ncbi:MAG: hypothetical protein GXO58_05390 [Thermodesulfobacteria bacterium]|nr:hypothetical protein [Thermodesulfobacteriota bacterium]
MPLFLALFLGSTLFRPADSLAWYTLLHQDIAKEALENAPSEIKNALGPYSNIILWNSMVPDMFLQDWENHEWNVHGGPSSTFDAPGHIDELAAQLITILRGRDYKMEEVASLFGLLSHYMADVNQPLHTDDYLDDNAEVHLRYEMDVYSNRGSLNFVPTGVAFWEDIRERVIQSCMRANVYYPLIMEEYQSGQGLEGLKKITQLCYQSAVSDIIDLWSTIWFSARAKEPVRIALKLDMGEFSPKDVLSLQVSSIVSRPCLMGDLYLMLQDENGTVTYLSPSGRCSETPLPARAKWHPMTRHKPISIHMEIPDSFQGKDFDVTGLVVPKGQDVAFGPYLSNRPGVRFHIGKKAFDNLGKEITEEPYLFLSASGSSEPARQLVIHSWDLIFLGDKAESPLEKGEESSLDLFAPGKFRHVMMYLGRDAWGRPVALDFAGLDGLVLFRLPESIYETTPFVKGSSQEYDLFAYKNRTAKRLNPQDLQRVEESRRKLMRQIELDLEAGLPYQVECYWSGNLWDKSIHLVDDGRANGVSCTDYLLGLLEDNATVCIHGSRMNAVAIEDYIFSHPEVLHAKIPSKWNPFPCEVSIYDIFEMGFYLVDPPPHIFRCDGTTETGVPVPSSLAQSPQLDSITPVPVPPFFNGPVEEGHSDLFDDVPWWCCSD